MLDNNNSSHKQPAYFEWWYYHFACANGTAINMVVHETDIFGLNQAPYLSVSICQPNKPPAYLKRSLENKAFSQQQSLFQLQPNLIQETATQILFDIPFPDRNRFCGEINKLAAPISIKDGVLYQDKVTGATSHWLLQVPHSTFSAMLELDGSVHPINGTAYQDHQWGTICLQSFVSDWVWGHFSDEKTAVTFFQILTQNGRCIERVAIVMDEGQFIATKLDTSYLSLLMQQPHPEQFENKVNVAFLNQQIELSFDVLPTKQMRTRLNEVHDGKTASYLRWAATASYQTGCEPHTLYGITEYIRIRQNAYGGISSTKQH